MIHDSCRRLAAVTMVRTMHRPFTRFAILLAAALLAACASLQLPWRKPPPAAPVPVSELIVEGVAGQPAPTVLQYWDRNTLRVDLTMLAGSGSLQLRAQPPNGWPVRLAFTVRPGSFRTLQVRGAQRLQFAVAESGAPLTLLLPPGVYSVGSDSLSLRWE